VQLSVTSDNGGTWVPLCGKYTIISANPMIEGLPSYEGKQNDWVQEKIDLNAYLGQQIKFRFELVSDWWPWNKPDGFYFDDFIVHIIDTTVISASCDMKPQNNIVEVFPNPFNEFLNVKISDKEEADVQLNIFNTLGQLVYQNNDAKTSEIINTSLWEEGMYYILLNKQGGVYYKKFIKFAH